MNKKNAYKKIIIVLLYFQVCLNFFCFFFVCFVIVMQMSSSPSSLTTAVPLYDLRQKVYALLNGTFHAAVVLDIGRNLKLNNDNIDEDE